MYFRRALSPVGNFGFKNGQPYRCLKNLRRKETLQVQQLKMPRHDNVKHQTSFKFIDHTKSESGGLHY